MQHDILCYSQYLVFEDQMAARWPDLILLVEKKEKKKDDGITSGEYFSNPPFTLIVTVYRDYDRINMSCRPPKR